MEQNAKKLIQVGRGADGRGDDQEIIEKTRLENLYGKWPPGR